jgi:hypothetical protein
MAPRPAAPSSPDLRRRRLTLALAVLWLALGYANVVRGVAHAGPRYRFWSFQHHCYSDVIAMHGDRYLGGGRPVPYLQDQIEYPVLLGLALYLPSFAPGGLLGYFTVSYVLLAACLLATLLALDRIPGTRAWWLGATPALVYYAGLNWDLLPVALLALALLALARGRAGAGGALTALGVSAKLFPGVLAPPALLALAARAPRGRALRFGAATAATLLAVNGPVAWLARDGFLWFFRFNAGRGAENSIWHALGWQKGWPLELGSMGPMLLATTAAAAATLVVARAGRDWLPALRLGVALALVAWIATNKIWSPQYALYGFLAGALAAAPLPAFLALTAASAADFHVAFETRARRWDPAFVEHVFHPDAEIRTVLWLALAAWIARALWRAVRDARAGAAAERGAPAAGQ